MAAELPLSLSAQAKINLALHVTGRRADGYHELDSLVVFVGLADHLEISHSDELHLSVDGPTASGVPDDERNLVLKAALALRSHAGDDSLGAKIHLTKHIPHAAGLGGGSADAAAALKGLSKLWGVDYDLSTLEKIGLTLGADVPICLHTSPVRMQGIGEQISPVSLDLKGKPALLLINPGTAILTKAVFSGFGGKFGAGLSPMPEEGWSSVAAFASYLQDNRNDLEGPACKLAPSVGKVLEALGARPECRLARMSGSGATCYGLFPEERWAWKAMLYLKDRHPDWWFAQTPLGREGDTVVPDH